jgi:oligopeptidase B
MRMGMRARLLASAVSTVVAGCAGAPSTTAPAPPVAPQKPHDVVSPHGTRPDPYYWMRDDTRASPEVLAHLAAENAYKDAMLAPTRALQQRLYDEIVGRIKQDDTSPPTLHRGYWYYTRFQTGREYPIYCRRKGTMGGPEEILLDGNAMAVGKAYFHIGNWAVSPDNQRLAWVEDVIGRRQYTLRFKDLRTGRTWPDAVANVDPGIAWANDNRTVLYVEKDPQTLLGERVKKHVLGTPVASDALVHEEKDPSFYIAVAKSKDERYLLIGLESTLVSEWRYADAADPALALRTVLPREERHEYQVEHIDGDFIIRTNWQAPNFRLVRVPVGESADKSRWRDLVPHSPEVLIENFDVFRDFLAINERSGGLRKVRLRRWSGEESQVLADEPAYTVKLGDTPEFDSDTVRYVYTSMTTPPTTYDHDVRTGARTLVKREPVLGDFDPAHYATEFLWAPARDGAMIPVSLVYRRDRFRRDGSAPLLQYGYGAYGYSMDPAFASSRLSLLDRGFVFAIAHVRGGQELGRAWYDHGRLLAKRNSFTDFIAVTEHLVRERYGAKDRIFAAGGSAGGLLMGAVVNLRPELYRGIVTQVPFVDVVTTMLDESIPLTTNEYDEWGNPAADKAYYDYMLSYSPYDNVRRQDYPAMLVITGLWDSQVQYYEPAKWVARLRERKTDVNPLLFHVNMDAGHGGKSGRFERYRDVAMEYAFLLDQAGLAR